MQVYANTFRVDGNGAYKAVIGAIHGWLKQKTKRQFSISEITRNNEFTSSTDSFRWMLRSYVSADETPELYAWRLKHSDQDVPGRQWVVELGLRIDTSGLEFSCSMHTEEQSTLVRTPIQASKPGVIRYVIENVKKADGAWITEDVPGLTVKKIGQQVSDYTAFKAEIERKDRDYPLVLVSPTVEGKFLINRQHLQDALFGLAQVVEVSSDFDSYEMEENLGKVWSAWRGAINILQTPRSNGFIHGSLLRDTDILEIGEKQDDRVRHILARVTHHTNTPRSRNRIRPEGVMQLALKRRLLKRSTANENDSVALKSENTALWNELETQEESYRLLQQDRESAEMHAMELEDKNQELQDRLRSLEYKASVLQKNDAPVTNTPNMNFLVELAAQPTPPRPEDCLKAIHLAFPNRCVILDSAWQSAQEMNSFQNGRRLLSLLQRLITDYVDAIENGGDSKARMIFSSDEYSANESESVEKSSSLSSKRRFSYKGELIDMFNHLKIGKADNVSHTLRVHFSWIPTEKKIVIGHCGEHLPISSH